MDHKNFVFIAAIKKCIEKYEMIKKGDAVFAAVSGGTDSIALLHVLHILKDDLGFNISVLHFNHKLRGKEADNDALFVKNTAERLRLNCVIKDGDVAGYSTKNKLSLQEAGRELRYEAFLKEAGNGKIAMGHNADDQAETILMRIIRGTGSDGVKGIPPVRDNIIRPMIHIKREEIEGFIKSNKIEWVEDPSNKKGVYTRNRVRNELLPILKKENPNIVDALNRFGDIIGSEDEFLSRYTNNIFSALIKKDNGQIIIDGTRLKINHISIQRRIIRRAIKEIKGGTRLISGTHIDDIISLNHSGKGRYITLPDHISARYEYNRLFLKKGGISIPAKCSLECSLNIPGETNIPEISASFKTEILQKENLSDISYDKPFTAFLDYDKTGEDLKIRFRKDGDRFKPLGMSTEKKLKNFFIDEKIPVAMRDKIPILLSKDGAILWITGIEISEDFKVDKCTKTLLKIEKIT